MMWLKRKLRRYYLLVTAVMLVVTLNSAAEGGGQVYLPVISRTEGTMVEVRGLWVTRFDWTNYASADPGKIDEIVDKSAAAGFNVLFFQVRGEADAYYTPGLEPWARRLSGTLGKDPGWDPLAHLIERAHQRGLEVHAYLNVYPLAANCVVPPDDTQPRHLYHLIVEKHGTTDGKPNGLMWDSSGEIPCAGYQRVTPASTEFDAHIVAVTKDRRKQFLRSGERGAIRGQLFQRGRIQGLAATADKRNSAKNLRANPSAKIEFVVDRRCLACLS
jgi:uncharacterized lipoprotein YddW (UPF0748 family)